MKKIYFVRHGESEANLNEIAGGGELDSLLTENGKLQAQKAGEELKSKPIDLVVCSPLTRTIETATIIANEIGYDPTKIIKKDYFIERNVGIYSKGPNARYMEDAKADKLHESVETTQEMQKRIDQGLDWLKTLDAENILLVSHGGVSRILRLIHQGLPHSHMYKIDAMPNATIYEFDL